MHITITSKIVKMNIVSVNVKFNDASYLFIIAKMACQDIVRCSPT